MMNSLGTAMTKPVTDNDAVPLVEVSNLSLRHRSKSGQSMILSDVSFTLDRGKILGIIGESGAGKSTIGNAILGLLPPDIEQVSGTIAIDGMALAPLDSDFAGGEFRRCSRIIPRRLTR